MHTDNIYANLFVQFNYTYHKSFGSLDEEMDVTRKKNQNLTYWGHLILSNLQFVSSTCCVKLLFVGVVMGRCLCF